jgi:hypothetical protein
MDELHQQPHFPLFDAAATHKRKHPALHRRLSGLSYLLMRSSTVMEASPVALSSPQSALALRTTSTAYSEALLLAADIIPHQVII